MLEQALSGARLLFAYTIIIEAPVEEVFTYMGEPEYWARDFEGEPLPRLKLMWEGRPYTPGSSMVLTALRSDGTPTPVGAVRMELLEYQKNRELSFRYLVGNHLIYRFVYEEAGPNSTEFTMNALLDAHSPLHNTMRQRLYANKRRKASIEDHLKVKARLEARARRRPRGEK